MCGFDGIDELDVFDVLSSLVDKSLVLVDLGTGRYRLLETLRQYGAERFDASGDCASREDFPRCGVSCADLILDN